MVMPLRPLLTVEEGPDKGRTFSSDAATFKIGRGAQQADFVLSGQDKAVSRVHFAVIRRGDTFLLNNLSTNGTSVNGVRTDMTLLNNNDILKLGLQTVIRFSLEEAPAGEADPHFG
jgi:predicted component of type VI protein secretion system